MLGNQIKVGLVSGSELKWKLFPDFVTSFRFPTLGLSKMSQILTSSWDSTSSANKQNLMGAAASLSQIHVKWPALAPARATWGKCCHHSSAAWDSSGPLLAGHHLGALRLRDRQVEVLSPILTWATQEVSVVLLPRRSELARRHRLRDSCPATCTRDSADTTDLQSLAIRGPYSMYLHLVSPTLVLKVSVLNICQCWISENY